jgi:hypothetical protein
MIAQNRGTATQLMGYSEMGQIESLEGQRQLELFRNPELKNEVNRQFDLAVGGVKIATQRGRIAIGIGTQGILDQSTAQGLMNKGLRNTAEASSIIAGARQAIMTANVELAGDDLTDKRLQRVAAIKELAGEQLKGITERIKYGGGLEQVGGYMRRGNLNAQSAIDAKKLKEEIAGAGEAMDKADKDTVIPPGAPLNTMIDLLRQIAGNVGVR